MPVSERDGRVMAEQSGGVLVVGEVDNAGALRPISFEMVGAGRPLADSLGQGLAVLLMGSGVGEAAQALGAAGANRLLIADDERLRDLTSEAATAVLSRVIRDLSPAVVLVPGTTAGRDYAPRVAARLGVGLAADCVELAIEEGELVAVRPILGGRVQTIVRMPGSRPQMATVHPGSFEKAAGDGATPEPEAVPVELGEADLRVRVRETVQGGGGSADLESADVVIGGGRGLKEAASFGVVEELAAALGGVVGATRAVTDAGWRPHHEQIGQTGRTVTPRLYIAVGVSGAVQHLVGIQGSDYIVAINRDPDAPIFKIASFGIVGDLFEIVPALTAELKAARG